MAIKLAAYELIKELAKDGIISEQERNLIREKNHTPVE